MNTTNETRAAIEAKLTELGLTIDSRFIPFSASRNAKNKHKVTKLANHDPAIRQTNPLIGLLGRCRQLPRIWQQGQVQRKAYC